MSLPFPRACLPAIIVALAGVAHAAEPAIITKARAYLGTDAALNAVKSVHYVGTVSTTDATDPTKLTKASIEIIAQQPDQQRVVAKSDKAIETTALDGYEGWQRTQDATDPQKKRQVVFPPDGVKRLRAQAWENLSFFHGIEQRGGKVEDLGEREADGIKCQKIAFIYGPTVVFYRYFDLATGRLVLTETEDGSTTREEGDKVVNGVRFPSTMKMTIKGPKGESQTVTITFDTITTNETFPSDLFRVPPPGS